MIYGYLRVSTDKQDVANQKHGILEYANNRGMTGIQFFEDSVSGRKHWTDRQLGSLFSLCEEKDIIVVAEISRIARTTLQVLEFIKECNDKKVDLHITKQGLVLDDSIQSKITSTVLGLAAEIDRDLISTRTKEALAKRKAEGMTLGRPKGKQKTLKLDKDREQIQYYMDKDVAISAIAKIIGCSRSTLYEYIERRGIVRELG